MSDVTENQETIEEPKEELIEKKEETKKTDSGSSFYKTKLLQMEKERQQLEEQLNQIKEQGLKEKENYKELWETEKNKRAEAEEKSKRIAQNYFDGLKYSAIEKEAMTLGIRKEALEDIRLLDASMVEIETTSTGNANVIGARDFVEMIKEKKQHWFTSGKAPDVNNGSSNNFEPKLLTPQELLKLQKEDPSKYREEMKKRIGK